jgi:hypothetical protein
MRSTSSLSSEILLLIPLVALSRHLLAGPESKFSDNRTEKNGPAEG